MFSWNHCCSFGISCSGSKQILILGRVSGPGRENFGLPTSESALGRQWGSLWMENCQLGREEGVGDGEDCPAHSPRSPAASARGVSIAMPSLPSVLEQRGSSLVSSTTLALSSSLLFLLLLLLFIPFTPSGTWSSLAPRNIDDLQLKFNSLLL